MGGLELIPHFDKLLFANFSVPNLDTNSLVVGRSHQPRDKETYSMTAKLTSGPPSISFGGIPMTPTTMATSTMCLK